MSRWGVFLLVLCWLMGCRSAEIVPTPTPHPILPLTITTPKEITAGDSAEITISGAPDQTMIALNWLGSWGSTIFTAQSADGLAEITIPVTTTQRSGLITLSAEANGYRGKTTLRVQSTAPIEPLTPLIGARSIVADGKSWAMAVVIPFDKFYNPVDDGTLMKWRIRHADGEEEQIDSETRHLLAWQRITSHTKSGKTYLSVATQNKFGSEGMLTEIAGWPVPFKLFTDVEKNTADGRQLVKVKTENLRDRFGNLLENGTAVDFIISSDDSAEGVRRITSYVIDGSAEFVLQSPDHPQKMRIKATIHHISSSPLTLTFTPNLTEIPLKALYAPEFPAIQVIAGPLLGDLDQYIPDGTPATLTVIRDDQRWEMSVVVEGGYARFSFVRPQWPAGEYQLTVTVAGLDATTSLTLP